MQKAARLCSVRGGGKLLQSTDFVDKYITQFLTLEIFMAFFKYNSTSFLIVVDHLQTKRRPMQRRLHL